ncbi:hypothetical protein NX722_11745 [Endozoicomonas gorgoniicola]|uniref:Uncharacterized protein n=1 Tax=Endozoicomonas gorgoniicola TaxID=1234144 RepID=A0ABT3MVB3_9GAMM|nr:hypothetical protein [Endozoicomonas gorgoniicola]MCW7553298.1 hypothetical protein [Endozoicomonas gorgoniicola]
MTDQFAALHHQGLAVFGQSITVSNPDGESFTTRGMFKKELIPSGQFENTLQSLNVLLLTSSQPVKRGYIIDQAWVIDRKIQDDGQLTTWTLYEYLP